MQRHRYIRFFISSTFNDMTIERDLLQEVMADLAAKYLSIGWQIEYVDLRWGITNEAGLDNRTMRICLDELLRCQTMSPKPNFIVLVGQRRGWIPLPEIITVHEMSDLLIKANDIHTHILLHTWYKLDANYSDEPLYILQPRKGKFISDDAIWETEVYKPLISLFNQDLLSATEREINNGALNVENAHEHVVVYTRTLNNIPQSCVDTYIEHHDMDNVYKLRRTLRDAVDKDNLYAEDLSFVEYQSASFRNRFKQEMTI